MNNEKQKDVDAKNSEFWDELCGTQLAEQLGITDSSQQSLQKFDDFYFNFYPYLLDFVDIENLQGKSVLEVGLGYGSLSQKLMEAGATYQGLDISAGPVELVNIRAEQIGKAEQGKAGVGSILEPQFGDEQFDKVIAIGCFHHTGNTQAAIDQSYRMLKPGGCAHIMIYNSYSYRRWQSAASQTFKYLLWDKFKIGSPPGVTEADRAAYDANKDGGGAPHTEFYSKSHIKRMTASWSSRSMRYENVNDSGVFARIGREKSLKLFGKYIGLDLYCKLYK